jgi:hypothetical protein
VSNALEDAAALTVQLKELKTLLSEYKVPLNLTIQKVLTLLRSQRMDRAIDLLYDGQFYEFATMSAEDSSYSSRARTAVQTVGGSVSPTQTLSSGGQAGVASYESGVDGSTGKGNVSATRAVINPRMTGVATVETQVALAQAVSDLSADELIRSMLQLTLDEIRNQSVFELIGQTEGATASDQDPTLPWISQTGSVREKLEAKINAAIAAIDYMIQHPELYEDTGEST